MPSSERPIRSQASTRQRAQASSAIALGAAQPVLERPPTPPSAGIGEQHRQRTSRPAPAASGSRPPSSSGPGAAGRAEAETRAPESGAAASATASTARPAAGA